MMFNRNEKKLGVQTPTYSRFSMTPNPNLGWQPTESSGTKPPKPPTSGSNAVKQPNVGSSVQRSKQFCPYETPCGWCTKWDKKCDKKIGGNSTITETVPKRNNDNSPALSCDKCVHLTELSSYCGDCHPIFKHFERKKDDQ